MSEEQRVFGISWYKPEQWLRLKEISEDRDKLDDTYEDWRRNANIAIQELQAAGVAVKRVNVNPEELLAWCNKERVPVNGKSRAEYVAVILEETFKS